MSDREQNQGEGQQPKGRDERGYWAKQNLEKRLVDSGMSSEKAHERAAKVARDAEQKNKEKKEG